MNLIFYGIELNKLSSKKLAEFFSNSKYVSWLKNHKNLKVSKNQRIMKNC